MTYHRYKTSFTAGGLFHREALKIAERFFVLNDWVMVRSDALESNLLQTRTRASAVRLVREAIQRVQRLTQEQLELLVNATREEQNQLLWLAACKHYRLIAEFAQEVIHEKFLRADLQVSYRDYDIFFNAKAEWNTDLDQLTPRTKSELRIVLFHMMKEAEIISTSGQIQPLILSPRVAQAIQSDDPAYFRFYPANDLYTPGITKAKSSGGAS